MALALGVGLVFAVGGTLEEPAPDPARLTRYYDDPIKVGIVLAMIRGVFAMGVGLWVAALMVWPDATFGQAWSGYGRLRPVPTTGVIFAFGGNALIATSLHVMQRTCRARLADQLSPWVVLVGYNLFLVWAVSGYFMGVTQSKEYAEPEWYADEMIANAPRDALAQTRPDSDAAEGVIARYGEATTLRPFSGSDRLTEMDALVADLQVPGQLTQAPHAQGATP
ncbi:MAG: cbb3-type cytochrome c oxidase subunit I [Gemmobacter sp.]|uniref:cbb3-type cytochrome c oxidase subunit I n=1 Tax=Gemmobacter sp. TaxID=1898957 RepID=UPI00391B963B